MDKRANVGASISATEGCGSLRAPTFRICETKMPVRIEKALQHSHVKPWDTMKETKPALSGNSLVYRSVIILETLSFGPNAQTSICDIDLHLYEKAQFLFCDY